MFPGEYDLYLIRPPIHHYQLGYSYLDLSDDENRSLEIKTSRHTTPHITNSIGFNYSDYTKLDVNGGNLSDNAIKWACVRDNYTGLIWEVKTNDGSIHDRDKKYRWGGWGISEVALDYKHTGNTNKRFYETSWDNSGVKYGDWNKLVKSANSNQLCGFNNWRVPDLYELSSIVRCHGGYYKDYDWGCEEEDEYRLPIDNYYFPYTRGDWYWSASPDSYSDFRAWKLDFGDGYVNIDFRLDDYRVRLVSSGK